MNIMEMNPVVLLSVVNTKLRDQYANLNELCEDLDLDQEALVQKLVSINYTYDPNTNQFK